MAKVELAQLLLGPKYYKENFGKPIVRKAKNKDNQTILKKDDDLAAYYFGDKFQKRLRRRLHKTESKYKCTYCNNSGIVARDDKYTEFVEFLVEFGSIEMTQGIKEAFKAAGLAVNIRQKRNKNKKYAVATHIFEAVLKKSKKVRAVINEEIRKVRTEQIGEAPGPESYKKIEQFIARLDEFKNVVAPCPICLGNGYYDIGHTSFVGKQVDCMRLIYEKYIVQDKRPWTYKIDEDVLWNMFNEQEVEPEIPEQISRHVELDATTADIGRKTINRLHAETQRLSQIKDKFYESMNSAYKTGEASFKYKTTYDQIIQFYSALIHSAREYTGTLKEYLSDSRRKLVTERQKQAGMYKTSDGKVPYMGNYIIINGPTVIDSFDSVKLSSRKKKSYSLYVYAEMFVDKKTWSKNKTTTVYTLENQAHLPENFVIYFPQRNAN